MQAIRASGASSGQTLFYAILPALLPGFLTYIPYRWEVIIRTTIVDAVAVAGLGREFRLPMSFFHHSDVLLLLLVFMVDGVRAFLGRLSR